MVKAQVSVRQNVGSYVKVMAVWLSLSIVSASVFRYLVSPELAWWKVFAWAALTCFGGMMIMFMASVLNLRKLKRGFQRLAAGEKDPQIPAVWCPVLTMATRAAVELADRFSILNSSSEKMSKEEKCE